MNTMSWRSRILAELGLLLFGLSSVSLTQRTIFATARK